MNWRKTAAVFPGQGSQTVGMGKDFAQACHIARATFEQADEILGFRLSTICWEGPQTQLDQTIHTQPALYVTSLAIWRVLKQCLPDSAPAWMAGHSLGELSALTAAGALPYEDGLKLVYARGSLMRQAGRENPGAMAALLAMTPPAVKALCAAVSKETAKNVVLANDNCPGQLVVSGHSEAVDRLIELAPAAGARRALKLSVSVAAHSPLMTSASAAFRHALDQTPLMPPKIAVYGNVKARPLETVQEIRHELGEQLTQTVRWTESMRSIIEDGAETFIEMGANNVLSGLMRRIDRRKTSIALNSIAALDAFLEGQTSQRN